MATRTPHPSVAIARGRIGGLVRERAADDPDLLAARRDLAVAKITDYVARVVDAAPPLTPEQRDRLASILRGGGAE